MLHSGAAGTPWCIQVLRFGDVLYSDMTLHLHAFRHSDAFHWGIVLHFGRLLHSGRVLYSSTVRYLLDFWETFLSLQRWGADWTTWSSAELATSLRRRRGRVKLQRPWEEGPTRSLGGWWWRATTHWGTGDGASVQQLLWRRWSSLAVCPSGICTRWAAEN